MRDVFLNPSILVVGRDCTIRLCSEVVILFSLSICWFVGHPDRVSTELGVMSSPRRVRNVADGRGM